MIECETYPEQGILLVRPESPLEEADFGKLSHFVDSLLANGSHLNGLMIHTESFPGWESFTALLRHLRFIREHQQYIERVAVVTDDIQGLVPEIAGHFVDAEVRRFDYEEKTEAMQWLQHGQSA